MSHANAGRRRKIDDTILQQLWMRCLPSHMAACLANCSDKCDLEELAEEADKIQECYDRHPLFQLVQPKPCPTPQETDTLAKILAKLDTLGCNSPPPKCGRQRLRPQSRDNKPSNYKCRVCYYHRTYGDDAEKCQPGCTYPKVNKANPQEKARTDLGNISSRLLYVTDRNSKLKFFIGTSLQVTVIVGSTEQHFLHPAGLSLYKLQIIQKSALTVKTTCRSV